MKAITKIWILMGFGILLTTMMKLPARVFTVQLVVIIALFLVDMIWGMWEEK